MLKKLCLLALIIVGFNWSATQAAGVGTAQDVVDYYTQKLEAFEAAKATPATYDAIEHTVFARRAMTFLALGEDEGKDPYGISAIRSWNPGEQESYHKLIDLAATAPDPIGNWDEIQKQAGLKDAIVRAHAAKAQELYEEKWEKNNPKLAGNQNPGGKFKLAIKIDLTPLGQQIVNGMLNDKTILSAADGLSEIVPGKGGTLHLSIGFVENLSSREFANQIGKAIVDWLSQNELGKGYTFEVDRAENAFKTHLALIPIQQTVTFVSQLNQSLQTYLQTTFKVSLNALTKVGAYTPHISLKRGHPADASDATITKLNQLISAQRKKRADKRLFFKLSNPSYSVF